MTLLDRYVLRRAAAPFALGLVFGAALLALIEGTELHGAAIAAGGPAPRRGVAAFLARAMPFYAVAAAPVAALLGAAAAVGGMARAGEILAARAAGVSPARIALPLVAAAAVVAIFLAALGEWIVPDLYHEALEIRREIRGRPADPPVFLDAAVGIGGRLVRLDRFEPAAGTASGVEIDRPDAAFRSLAERTSAETAVWDGRRWVLHGVETVRVGGETIAVEREASRPSDLEVPPPALETLLAAQRTRFLLEDRPAEARRFSDLLREVRLFSAVRSLEGRRYRNRLRTDLHAKAALAAAPIALALLGAGAAAGAGRRTHPAAAAAVTLLSALAMWIGLETARALGATSRFPAAVPWIPWALAAAAGLMLLRRT